MGWFRLSVLTVLRIAIVIIVAGMGAVMEEGEGVLLAPQLLKLKEAIFK